jgi:transposase
MGKIVSSEKREEILNLIQKEGCTIRQAAELGEVSEKTIRVWIRKKTNGAGKTDVGEIGKLKKENAFLKEILVNMLLEKETAKKNRGVS